MLALISTHPMANEPDCFSCKVVSTAGLAAAGAYFAFGAWKWPKAQKKFLIPASAGKSSSSSSDFPAGGLCSAMFHL